MQLTFLQEELLAAMKEPGSVLLKKPGAVQPTLSTVTPPKSPHPKEPPAAPVQEAMAEPENPEPAFRTISEVAESLSVPQHVLRFWESRFPQIKPTKLRGGRRYYRPQDVEILTKIKHLLYKQGYTIKGARKAFGKADFIEEVGEPALPPPQANDAKTARRHELIALKKELLRLRDALKPLVH